MKTNVTDSTENESKKQLPDQTKKGSMNEQNESVQQTTDNIRKLRTKTPTNTKPKEKEEEEASWLPAVLVVVVTIDKTQL